MHIAEAVLNTLSEAILVLDLSLRAVTANRAAYQLLPIPREDLKGKPIEELLPGSKGMKKLRSRLRRVASQEGHVETIRVKSVVPELAPNYLLLSARRVHFHEDLPCMVLVEFSDITNEVEALHQVRALNADLLHNSNELQSINRELDSFTHSASHDMRTPLRFMNKIAHLLLEEHGLHLPVGAIEKIGLILDSTEEMSNLIELLLIFSKVKREPIRKRRVDPVHLAHEALRELQDDQEGRSINFTVDALPPALADRTLLKHVLVNLMANALKYTRTRDVSTIHLGFEQAATGTVYFIRDNGVGFSEADAESIFLPFVGPLITFTRIPRDWARGFREVGRTRLNVSAGIGAEHAHGLPSIRINCPPEMTLIHFVPDGN